MRAAQEVSLILVRWQVAPERERLSAELLAASMAKAIDDATGLPELLAGLKEAVESWELEGMDETDDSAAGEAMAEWKAAIAKAEGK